jgi:hypothetical protein
VYPDVGLKGARDRLDEVRKQVAANIDPSERRKAEKAAIIEKVENTFEAIAREWFTLHSPKWAASHGDKIIRRLELNIFLWLGDKAIKSITAPELLGVGRWHQRSCSTNGGLFLGRPRCGRSTTRAVTNNGRSSASAKPNSARQRKLVGAVTPWRRATSETDTASSPASAMIASFCGPVYRRRAGPPC